MWLFNFAKIVILSLIMNPTWRFGEALIYLHCCYLLTEMHGKVWENNCNLDWLNHLVVYDVFLNQVMSQPPMAPDTESFRGHSLDYYWYFHYSHMCSCYHHGNINIFWSPCTKGWKVVIYSTDKSSKLLSVKLVHYIHTSRANISNWVKSKTSTQSTPPGSTFFWTAESPDRLKQSLVQGFHQARFKQDLV